MGKCSIRRKEVSTMYKTHIGDEFHYLLCCKFFEPERKRLLKPYFYTRPTCHMLKYKDLLCSDNIAILKKLSEFVKVNMSKLTS